MVSVEEQPILITLSVVNIVKSMETLQIILFIVLYHTTLFYLERKYLKQSFRPVQGKIKKYGRAKCIWFLLQRVSL